MAISTQISEETYRRLALGDPDRQWELHEGRPREKPAMTFAHNHQVFNLGILLNQQLDRNECVVGVNGGRVRRSVANFYIPDVFVAPRALTDPLRDRMDVLEVYAEPLPLMVEIWSPSTGDYDIDEKLLEYQFRGDLEI